MRSWPDVAVVMPARDAEADLEPAISAVRAQDYPGPVQVAVAVAPSRDRTRAAVARLAAADDRITVVDNPRGGTAAGLNAAIAATSAPIVARVDTAARLPPGYLRRAVELLTETGADNVGGVQQAHGRTPFERAAAVAMTSPAGAGDARFRNGGPPGPVDTVYLGVFRRAALDRVGGFDESLERNQDYELNWRIRATGGTVYFHPDLQVRYRVRPTLGALARQYHDYGRWKHEVVRRHPRSLRWRQLAPPVAVIANAAGLALGLAGRRAGFMLPGAYAAGIAAATLVSARRLDPAAAVRLPVALVTMHHAWGLGFLRGARARAAAPPR